MDRRTHYLTYALHVDGAPEAASRGTTLLVQPKHFVFKKSLLSEPLDAKLVRYRLEAGDKQIHL